MFVNFTYPNFIVQVVLKTIMLRRTKNHVLNGKPIITLPARNVSVVQCKFDSDEHTFYKTLSQRMTTELDKLVQANEASKNYTHVLLMLLRLRQGGSMCTVTLHCTC
jgi:SNF2 family DNA or RNA helicase